MPATLADPLPGFTHFLFPTQGDTQRTVYRTGSGSGVLLMHELPGMVPECVELARRIASRNFTVFMPLLFGKPGKKGSTVRHAICIRKEFNFWHADQPSAIVEWLRALARHVAAQPECGPRVGAIGMCLTGGLALALVVEDAVTAPVMCQPSLPLTTGISSPAKKRSLDVAPATMALAKKRAQNGLQVLGYKFEKDLICPKDRFERLRSDFGDAFHEHVVPGQRKHSVFTLHEKNVPERQRKANFEALVAFLHDRLT